MFERSQAVEGPSIVLVAFLFGKAHVCVFALFGAEEILDDGVGLLMESSGDSLDDDSEIFSEADECRKVKARVRYISLSGGVWLSVAGSSSFLRYAWLLCLFSALVLLLSQHPPQLCYYKENT